jgi:glucose-6-phosphate isomerase
LANELGQKRRFRIILEIINQTENRAVLHTALRAKESAVVYVNGKNIVPDVYDVKKIQPFE